MDELSEEDFDLKTQFCDQIFGMRNEFLHLTQDVIFSDEANFCL